MGLWAQGTKKKFHFEEMRFEVSFETPVIFLRRPHDDQMQLSVGSVHVLDRTAESYHATRTPPRTFHVSENVLRDHSAGLYDKQASWIV